MSTLEMLPAAFYNCKKSLHTGGYVLKLQQLLISLPIGGDVNASASAHVKYFCCLKWIQQ